MLARQQIEVSENVSFETDAGRFNCRIEPYKDIPVCPRCMEPMVFTFEFKYKELYCQGCGWMCGIFGASRVESTKKLRNRLAQLGALYEQAREDRSKANEAVQDD